MSPQAQALQQQMASYLAAGGTIEVVDGFQGIAPLPARRDHIAPAPKKPRRATSRRPAQFTDAELALVRALAPIKTITEVSRTSGISRSALATLAAREGFTFKCGKGMGRDALEKSLIPEERRRSLAERIRAFQGLGLTRAQAHGKSGAGKRLFMQICSEYGIQWPTAEGPT